MSADIRKTREWTKGEFLLSTDPALVPLRQLDAVFASEEVYWAKSLPEPDMRVMLDNSMVFAIYDQSTEPTEGEKHLVGFGRCITDFTTFAYLTDVWVKPTYQGKGLGTWLVSCINSVLESMPYIRRTMLFTGDWKRSIPFYEKLMGANVMQFKSGEGLAALEKKGKGHPSYGKTGSSYT